MAPEQGEEPGQGPRLHRHRADRHPPLAPVGDCAGEAAFFRRMFETHCRRPTRTLLDLGSGGGHGAAHLKATLTCSLVDLAPAMLAPSRRLHPDCEHLQGDMRATPVMPTRPTSFTRSPRSPRCTGETRTTTRTSPS